MASGSASSESSSDELRTPWIPYPGRYNTRMEVSTRIDISSEYHTSDTLKNHYLSEMKSLNSFVSSKTESEYDFVFVATGAVMDDFYAQSLSFPTAMERIRSLGPSIQEIWWRLMFPYQLEKFKIDNPESKILILIIAPDKHFNPENPKYYHPRFMDKFHTYGWKHLERNTWFSEDDTIEVRLFNCPVPGYLPNLNEGINCQIEWAKRHFSDEEQSLCIIERMRNCEKDKDFVKSFYQNLDTLFKRTEDRDGLIMAINGAVINSRDRRSNLGKSYFIKDLNPLFNKDTPKRILGSWEYNDFLSHFTIYLNYQIGDKSNTCFIKPDKSIQDSTNFILPKKSEKYFWVCYDIDDLIERYPESNPEEEYLEYIKQKKSTMFDNMLDNNKNIYKSKDKFNIR